MDFVTQCTHKLKRINEDIFALSNQPRCPFSFRVVSGVSFVGPLPEVATALKFVNWSVPRLIQSVSGDCICVSQNIDGWIGISETGLVQLCSRAGHAAALCLLPRQCDVYTCVVRAFEKFVALPSTVPHPLLSQIRVFHVDECAYFVEADIAAFFGLRSIDHVPELLAGLFTNATQSRTPGQPPLRLLFDVQKQTPLAGAMNASKNRQWAVSASGACALFQTLVQRSCTVDSSPIAIAMRQAAHALVLEVGELVQMQTARRRWAAVLCEFAADVIDVLPSAELSHEQLTTPLQRLAASLGRAALPRNRTLASQMVSTARKSQLGIGVLSQLSPAQYLERFSEPITRAFVGSLLQRSVEREQQKRLPNLTRIERAQTHANASLITISDAVLGACHSQLIPPLSDAVGQEVYTVSSKSNTFAKCV